MKTEKYVRVQGKLLKLSNTSKIFYPEARFTKQHILDYYRDIGPTVLPHLKDRPFTLKRYPDGIGGLSFYEKQCPHHREKWVRTACFGATNHCLLNDLPSLLWAVNLAAIELHTTLGTISDLQRPTVVVFDLDPGDNADIRQCVEVALLMKRLLTGFKLESFPKTSGKKGVHLYVPLNTKCTFEDSREFARRVSESLERHHPDLITSKMPKKHRVKRVYIDWHQNVDFKSTVTVYSLRANDRPTVSTPITWKEVSAGGKRDSDAFRLLQYEAKDVIARVRKYGDLFAPVLSIRQDLPAIPEVRMKLAA